MNQTISNIDNNGQLVTLSDGSKWEVNFRHTLRSSLWLPGNQVTVIGSSDVAYPSILVNKTRVECVQAKGKSA